MQSFKKLYRIIRVQSQIDKVLQINQHSFVKDEYFMRVVRSVQKLQKNQVSGLNTMLMALIKKKLYKQKIIMRLLFIVHQVLRQNRKFDVSNAIIQLLFQLLAEFKNIKQQSLSGIDSYLKNVFSLPYSAYLIKAYGKQSQQQFQQQLNRQKCNKKSQKSTRNIQNSKLQIKKGLNKDLPTDQIDFTTFNKVSDVLKFSKQLNQMGRFYPEHQYIINFYLQMLRDLQNYFINIKAQCQDIMRLKKAQITDCGEQKILLFLSESQKYVNHMNCFYHNKYLYYYVNKIIDLKMELEIPQSFYRILNKQCQKFLNKQKNQLCLTAHSHNKKHKTYLEETDQSNRSKQNELSKITTSITSLNQVLERIQCYQFQSKSKKILQQKDQNQLNK